MRNYDYDDVGNRNTVSTSVAGNRATVEAYTSNSVNAYNSIDGQSRQHDDSGNLTETATQRYEYDYKNRLVRILDITQASDRPLAEYQYLSDGRRAQAIYYDLTTGSIVEQSEFLHDGWSVVEERNGNDVTTASYIWHPSYIDCLLEIEQTAAHASGAGKYHVHQNARYDVIALTDANQANPTGTVETYRYEDFGKALTTSSIGNPYSFQGRRYDARTGLHYYRNRMYDAETGRFLQRDPVWDVGNVGNQYTFVGNGPASGLDPMGTDGMLKFSLDTLSYGAYSRQEQIARSYNRGETSGLGYASKTLGNMGGSLALLAIETATFGKIGKLAISGAGKFGLGALAKGMGLGIGETALDYSLGSIKNCAELTNRLAGTMAMNGLYWGGANWAPRPVKLALKLVEKAKRGLGNALRNLGRRAPKGGGNFTRALDERVQKLVRNGQFVGQNATKVRTIDSGCLKGFTATNTSTTGGARSAKLLFRALTGRSPSGAMDSMSFRGLEVLYRAVGKSGHAKIEVVNGAKFTLEKITFLP